MNLAPRHESRIAADYGIAPGELVEKQQLYENLALYCRGQDRKDLGLMKSTFWPDATDDHITFVGLAHDFCEWAYENQRVSKHTSQHYITNVLLSLHDGMAKRESAFIYLMIRPEGGATEVRAGRYRDLCERRGDVWKVLRRVVISDHRVQLPGGIGPAAVPDGIWRDARHGELHPKDAIYEDDW